MVLVPYYNISTARTDMLAIDDTTQNTTNTKRSPTPHDVGDMCVCWADMSGRHGQMSSKVTFGELKNVDISD
jgi:hypothetical protein